MSSPEPEYELASLDASIRAAEAASRKDGPGQPGDGHHPYDLGVFRMARFSLTGEQADLDACVSDFEAAVAVIPPADLYHAMALASLAGGLVLRFERDGEPAGLEAAIGAANAALDAAAPGHPARQASLSALGTAFLATYRRTGLLDDLNASIREFLAATEAVGDTNPARPALLSDLGVALRTRFEHTSDPADLDAAIKAGRTALAASLPDDPDRAGLLSNVAVAFLRRFQIGGALADADDAIKALRAAALGVPPGHPHAAPVQSNLAVALVARYLRTEVASDLDDAVSASRQAASAGDRADPRFAGMASTAGLALFSRYQRTDVGADLDSAIDMARMSVDAMPAGHVSQATYLMNLGGFLHARFERTGDPADLDGAIRASYQARDATPIGHVSHGDALVDVGVVLRSRFRLTGLPSDREAARGAFVTAADAEGTPPSVRARAAFAAARLAAQADDPAQAARLLEGAVLQIAGAAPWNLSRGDKQHAIGEFAGLAGAAASAALADPSVRGKDRPARALALLEASRAVLLSQALDTRDDVTDLRGTHPDLADRFVGLRDRLDQPQDTVALPGDPLAGLGRETEDRARLAEEFTRTLREIRALEKHARFGLPPSVDELHAEAVAGPVVTFTVSSAGGGALLLTAGGIGHLDLPGLTLDAVNDRVKDFHEALSEAGGDDEDVAAVARRRLTATLEWLWDTATGPVLDALGCRTRPAEGDPWPRVWWVPGGLLGLLPVHAAGHHAEKCAAGEPARSVLDSVVSSYTPTVRALRYARQQARDHDGAGRALVVVMPATPGQGPLPGAAAEAAKVCAVLLGPVVLAGPTGDATADDRDNLPTRENVLRYLPACSIAHFACHADSDPADPSRSMLLLSDYETTPLTVAALAPVDHERLELTYLSACGTAFTAATELADEAIHLTSAFQLAGSRHVIGTLWPVDDLVSLYVATSFYEGLRTADGAVDTDRAAVALHEAVHAMRRRWTADPSRWAPYLHAGA